MRHDILDMWNVLRTDLFSCTGIVAGESQEEKEVPQLNLWCVNSSHQKEDMQYESRMFLWIHFLYS